MYFKHNGTRYFFYSRDDTERIALMWNNSITEVYRVNSDGNLEFEDMMSSEEYLRQEIVAENIYESDNIIAFPVDEEGNLVFTREAGNIDIDCLRAYFVEPDIRYSTKAVSFGSKHGYHPVQLALPNSFLQSAKHFRDLFMDEFHGKRGEARENNAEMRKIWRCLSNEFPQLKLENSLLGMTKKEFENGEIIPEGLTMDKVLVHKFIYERENTYRELVDNGFGNAAAAALKKTTAAEWRLDKALLGAVYANLKGKRMKKEWEEQEWDNKMTLGLKCLLSDENKLFCRNFVKVIGGQVKDYFIWQEMRKYVPNSVSDTSLMEYLNTIQIRATKNMLVYTAASLVSSMRKIVEAYGIDEIGKHLKHYNFEDWIAKGREAKRQVEKRRMNSIQETFAINDYRKECNLSGDIGEGLEISMVKDSKELSEEEIWFFVHKMSVLSKHEVLYYVQQKENPDKRVFITINIKDKKINLLDNTPEAEAIFSEDKKIMCENFFLPQINRLHNLYLVNHEVV